jgi:hypothetical protein
MSFGDILCIHTPVVLITVLCSDQLHVLVGGQVKTNV